jgi:hypothetical protein
MSLKDRRARLAASPFLNGIDFVEVATDDQTQLRVHFLNGVSPAGPGGAVAVTVTGGERVPVVAVAPIGPGDWPCYAGHVVLALSVTAPGDFSTYTLSIDSPHLDSQFRSAPFTFKARCPTDVDCRPAPAACPVPAADVPLIDYLAKDFLSFRQALLDFSALRYPEWQERSEADFGMMFLEALCALADDLSYTQDRVAAEAALETATRSCV